MTAQKAQYNLTQAKLHAKGFDSVRAAPGCQENGGCKFEELALYSPDQLLPTHIVHFRLAKSGAGSLVAQDIGDWDRVLASEYGEASFLKNLLGEAGACGSDMDESRIVACKKLGDVARDDQRNASNKFLGNRKLVAQMAYCARSANEALQFEALRAWWNFSFNDPDNQALAMQHLGASFLSALLDSPNESLRQRATGLIWNLTQHDESNRVIFAESGVIQKLGAALAKSRQQVRSASSAPWGILHLLLGALANLAMSCGEQLRANQAVVGAGQDLLAMRIAPDVIQKQATRLICNIISGGEVSEEWQSNGYSYRTSAPREVGAAIEVS